MAGKSNVRTFTFDQAGLEKWMHQNRVEYTGDFVEGTLLDNFVLMCKRGFAAVYERRLNEWCSDYMVEFEVGAAQEVWSRWHRFEERSEGRAG